MKRSAPLRVSWWVRPPILTAILVTAVLSIGTVGYIVVEGWSPWDALYMTVITVTTVGYREVHPLTRGGEAFTVLLLVAGVGTVFYAVTVSVARVVEGGLLRRWETRRRNRMLDELSEHYIVCGYGRIGRVIVEEFRRQDVPYVVIDRDSERVQGVLDVGGLAVAADASSEDVLKRVGIERARGLIAAVGTDAENVYTVLSARLLRPDLFIIARAESEDAARKLRRAGADRVQSPYQIGGAQIALTALRPAVVDFVHLATSSSHLELSMEQIGIAAGSSLADKTLLSANLRQRFGVVVVGIQRANGSMDFNPAPDTGMYAGDQLVVLGPPDRMKDLQSAADVVQGASAR
jgi:voltage-gated potassium channel